MTKKFKLYTLITLALVTPATAGDAWRKNYNAALKMQTEHGLTCNNRIFSGPYYSAYYVCNDGVCYPVKLAVRSPALIAKLWLSCQ